MYLVVRKIQNWLLMHCAVPVKNRQNQQFNALCAAAEKDKINVKCTV